MQRLAEQKAFDDPAEERLAELIGNVSPFRADPFRRRRVLWQVKQRVHQPPRRALALGLVATLLLGLTGTAVALGYRLMRDKPAAAVGSGAGASLTQHLDQPGKALRRPSTAGLTPNASAAPSEVRHEAAPKTVRTQRSSGTDSQLATQKRTLHAKRDTPRAASEDPTLVVQAIRALRNEHQPARARRYLAEYLQTHPHGALVESALALSIEAAAAQGDPSASRFAKRYLARYPNGRFKSLAQKVLAQHGATVRSVEP